MSDALDNLPMPNEKFRDGIVLASAILRDDDISCAVVMVMQPTAPFYEVKELMWVESLADWGITATTSYDNIIPAAEAYNDYGMY